MITSHKLLNEVSSGFTSINFAPCLLAISGNDGQAPLYATAAVEEWSSASITTKVLTD